MAGQDGIIKLKGTLGGITFYKSKDGYLAREKGGIDRKRIANDPAFKRTRENGQEFGTAGKYGKFLRNAIRPILQSASDKRVVSRLLKVLMQIIKTDQVNERGLRNPVDGDLELLKGFEFNSMGALSSSLFTSYIATLDRITGEGEIEIPELIPNQLISAPTGTTHFKFVSAAAEVDFSQGNSIAVYSSTQEIPWNSNSIPLTTLINNVTPNSTLPLLQVLGIQFFQQINNVFYPLNNGMFNALAVVNIDKT